MRNIKILAYAFFSVLVLSTLFLLFSFGYTSLEKISVQNLDDRLQELRTQEAEFSKLEEKVLEWQNIGKSYGQFKTDHLMQYAAFSDFRNQLESIFQGNMLNSFKTTYRIKNLADDIVRVSLNFNLSGSYRDIKKFIFNIEKDNRMVYVEKLNLTKTRNAGVGKFAMEAYFVR
jgi:Tfp pilus assembly protein PilO